MTQSDIEQLRRDWFAAAGDGFTELDRLALQEWHESQGHQRKHPPNGSCFCCCEWCPPDGEP